LAFGVPIWTGNRYCRQSMNQLLAALHHSKSGTKEPV
jgi:hypothetical protein